MVDFLKLLSGVRPEACPWGLYRDLSLDSQYFINPSRHDPLPRPEPGRRATYKGYLWFPPRVPPWSPSYAVHLDALYPKLTTFSVTIDTNTLIAPRCHVCTWSPTVSIFLTLIHCSHNLSAHTN